MGLFQASADEPLSFLFVLCVCLFFLFVFSFPFCVVNEQGPRCAQLQAVDQVPLGTCTDWRFGNGIGIKNVKILSSMVVAYTAGSTTIALARTDYAAR